MVRSVITMRGGLSISLITIMGLRPYVVLRAFMLLFQYITSIKYFVLHFNFNKASISCKHKTADEV